jgi:predicted secreted hydrolase
VRLLAGIMAVATLAAPTVRFPRDHYGHRAGIEWWYFTGDVRGSDGHRYSVFFTLFKRGGLVLPVSQVVNLSGGAIVRHTETVEPASLGSSALRLSTKAATLVYDARRDTWTGGVGAAGYTLRFTARPLEPYVLHGGGTGEIRQATSTSHYYSSTRMSMSGRFGSVTFTGTAWFDHQWGDFANDRAAQEWDWFSCRFDDRTQLMLYRFRDGVETGTSVDRRGRGHPVGRFEAVPGARAFRAAGRSWPLDWTLKVPTQHLSLRLHAIVPDQLVRGVILPTFWEGAVTASGTKNGVCFVEETS